MSTAATIRDVYNALRGRLKLSWLEGRGGSERSLRGDFPGAGTQNLVGHLNCIHPNRIQIIGRAELVYLATLEPGFHQDMLGKLFDARPAAVILADDIEPEPPLRGLAASSNTPLLRSPLPDNRLVSELQYYLSRVLAERTTEHGVFMEILGIGLLLRGSPGIGKSELALELISRGHRLVADDAPQFSRIAPDIVSGRCPPLLQDFLEVRGLGILDIRAMFGDAAIKKEKYLQLIVNLQSMDDLELRSIDRLQGSYSTREVLGLPIPQVDLPVAPGREMSVLVEAAVRQYNLMRNGYDATEEFIRRQQQAIDDG